jgi:serine/threonine-protein kinase
VNSARFGRYRILAALGSDGIADVFLATQQGPEGSRFQKLLVLKRLRLDLLGDIQVATLFLGRARIAARMNHPNVMQVIDAGVIEGVPFVTTEFLEGQSLEAIRDRSRLGAGLDLDLELLVLSDVLAGLHYVHELTDFDGTPLGVVYGVVTPRTVHVSYDGQVKLVDVGLAGSPYAIDAGKRWVRHLAPEQTRAEAFDRRADVFAVGVLLWEAVTGQPLWGELTDSEVLQALAEGILPFSSPRAAHPGVDERIDAICQRALAARPADRYATADAFKQELDQYLEARGLRARTREVATVLARLFVAERARLRRQTEAILSATSTPPASGLPRLNPDESGDGLSPASGDEVDDDDAATRVRVSEGSAAHETPGDSPPPGMSASSMARGEVSYAAPPFSEVPEPELPPRAWEWPRRLLWVAAALAVTSLASVVCSDLRARQRDADAEAAAIQLVPPPILEAGAASGASREEPPTIGVLLSASPASARFTIDDAPVHGNPHRGRVPRDGQEHVIRVTASGYVTRDAIVPFTKDLVLDVALEATKPSVAPPPPAAAQRPHANTSAPSPSSGPSVSVPGPRPLDRTNPW